MKFTVNGNEIEIYKKYECIRLEGCFYYYTVFVKFGDYEIEILEENLGIALSNIDSVEKFEEFVDKYYDRVNDYYNRLEEEREEQRLLDKELELESYIRHMESIEQEE